MDVVTGEYNTATGARSLENTTGNHNTAIGFYTGSALTSGSNNIYIGTHANASSGTSTNEIAIGQSVTGAGSNTVSIGNTNVTAIKGQVAFSTYSDERIKRNIDDSKLGLNFIMKLRPVTYKMKNPADYPNELLEARFRDVPGNGPFVGEFERPADDENTYDGLIAQEVKEAMDEVGVNWSGWSKNESDGKEGVQYGALTIPLIKAIQEQQKLIEKLEARIIELENSKQK